MSVCSMRRSQPRALHVLVISSCLYSLYPESTLTAISENLIGARWRSSSRICSSAQLSLPPERPTMMRSPSSTRLKSLIAFVVFFAMRASMGLRYDMESLILPRGKRPDPDAVLRALEQQSSIGAECQVTAAVLMVLRLQVVTRVAAHPHPRRDVDHVDRLPRLLDRELARVGREHGA